MDVVSPLSQGPAPVSGGDSRVTRLLGPVIVVDGPERPMLAESVTECSLVRVDQPAIDMGDLHDTVISHIYRAGLVVHTCFEGAEPPLVDVLRHITDELDAAIRQLRRAAFESQVQRDARAGVSGQSSPARQS
jgi:hypothetical protein